MSPEKDGVLRSIQREVKEQSTYHGHVSTEMQLHLAKANGGVESSQGTRVWGCGFGSDRKDFEKYMRMFGLYSEGNGD